MITENFVYTKIKKMSYVDVLMMYLYVLHHCVSGRQSNIAVIGKDEVK
jgi:hypothetical protein